MIGFLVCFPNEQKERRNQRIFLPSVKLDYAKEILSSFFENSRR